MSLSSRIAQEPCQHEPDFVKTERLNDKNSKKLTKKKRNYGAKFIITVISL